jgi:hypothetical protein
LGFPGLKIKKVFSKSEKTPKNTNFLNLEELNLCSKTQTGYFYVIHKNSRAADDVKNFKTSLGRVGRAKHPIFVMPYNECEK